MKDEHLGVDAFVCPGIEGRLIILKESKAALAKMQRKLKRTKVADRGPIQKLVTELEREVFWHENAVLFAGAPLPKE